MFAYLLLDKYWKTRPNLFFVVYTQDFWVYYQDQKTLLTLEEIAIHNITLNNAKCNDCNNTKTVTV